VIRSNVNEMKKMILAMLELCEERRRVLRGMRRRERENVGFYLQTEIR
jgi:hypothetical protein